MYLSTLYLSIYLFIYSFIHSFIHPRTYPLTHLLTRSSILVNTELRVQWIKCEMPLQSCLSVNSARRYLCVIFSPRSALQTMWLIRRTISEWVLIIMSQHTHGVLCIVFVLSIRDCNYTPICLNYSATVSWRQSPWRRVWAYVWGLMSVQFPRITWRIRLFLPTQKLKEKMFLRNNIVTIYARSYAFRVIKQCSKI